MRVVRVIDGGVVGYPFIYTLDMDEREQGGPVVLRNYPKGGIAEGEKLHVVAIERGVESVEGRTLRKFDGGLPYATPPPQKPATLEQSPAPSPDGK